VALRELPANYPGRRKGWVAPNQFDLDFRLSKQSFSGLHRKFPTNRVKCREIPGDTVSALFPIQIDWEIGIFGEILNAEQAGPLADMKFHRYG
jgi:hypothetical protein